MLIRQFSHQNLRNGRQLRDLLKIRYMKRDQRRNQGYDPKLCVGGILDWKSARVQALWQCEKCFLSQAKSKIEMSPARVQDVQSIPQYTNQRKFSRETSELRRFKNAKSQ